METANKQKSFTFNKHGTAKNMTNPSRNPSRNPIPVKAVPIKVYFPDISLQKLNDTLCPSKKRGNKHDKNATQSKPNTSNTPSKLNKISSCDISKYLVEESNKIIIYSSAGIFEVVNNNLLQIYPIDVGIKEMMVNNNLRLLLDSSYMKRYESPSYQIPYHHKIKYKTIKTYKNDMNSNIKFILEMENDQVDADLEESIHDFYVLITSNEITNSDSKKPELSKFAKDEILSFLSRLNLYR